MWKRMNSGRLLTNRNTWIPLPCQESQQRIYSASTESSFEEIVWGHNVNVRSRILCYTLIDRIVWHIYNVTDAFFVLWNQRTLAKSSATFLVILTWWRRTVPSLLQITYPSTPSKSLIRTRASSISLLVKRNGWLNWCWCVGEMKDRIVERRGRFTFTMTLRC